MFLGKSSPKKQEKSGKGGPGGPSQVETFQIPVARWMFKKRSDSLGIFLGARESMQGFSPEHIQEVCTGNCRHTGGLQTAYPNFFW